MENDDDLDGKSLSPGPFTFTPDRIKSILQNDSSVRDPNSDKDGVPGSFVCEGFYYSFEDGKHKSYSQREHALLVEGFCTHLCELAYDAESHVSRLDDAFSTIVICNFQPKGPIPAILDCTLNLLSRLPARPLELPDLPCGLNPAYLIPSASSDEDLNPVRWPTLQAAHVSSNVIRCALLTTIDKRFLDCRLIDSIAELLEVASQLSSEAKTEPMRQQWFIVRAFLWTSWQRCIMIYFFQKLEGHLASGVDDNSAASFVLRGTIPSPGLYIQEMSKLYAGSKKSKYMCGWAFELLRNHPVCIGMDFRRFHRRYSEAFQNHPSRCIADNSESSCKGYQRSSCQRFKGMFIENQSAHDLGCLRDCERLTWDEKSYRSISGARAVSINDGTGFETKITYCEASKNTLAVSHVWSHGQGGRPEGPHGFNRCLHRRYMSIAKLLGCTSYWMDTPCIPEDHELRAESISKINEVFMQSKVTLVCDRDLMEIDVTDLSINVRERILVTLIVCDWNLRAWTLLEAFRGREAIYLLCKDNAVVPLKETIEIVLHHGSIDVGFLLLTVPHLLPSRSKRHFRPIDIQHVSGYLSVENSGSLLSYREASRFGDDIVIWSLLLEEQVFKDAESFWRSREGMTIKTGYLLSSAPRLGVRGLSWAPSSPTVHPLTDTSSISTSRLLIHGGVESGSGTITRDGLLADWLMYEFAEPGMARMMSRAMATIGYMELGSEKFCRSNMSRIRKKYLKGYRWGCLLRPIRYRVDAGAGRYEPVVNYVDTSKILVVVCAVKNRIFSLRDRRVLWEWKGIYEWDLTEPLPKLERTKDVLLV